MFFTFPQRDRKNSNLNARRVLPALACVLLAVSQAMPAGAANPAETSSGANAQKRSYRPVPPLPLEVGCWFHHSSTALEGALRGRALMIQAAGNYLLSLTQAEILHEQARTLARENRLHAGDYYRQIDAWRDKRCAESRIKNEAQRPMKYADAYGLNSDEINRATGDIAWPAALQTAEFDAVRTRLDELFRVRADYGGMPQNSAAEIIRRIERLKVSLRQNRGNLLREDYLAAQKFLSGLKLEAESVVL